MFVIIFFLVLSRSVDLTSQACDNEVVEFQKHQKELKLGQVNNKKKANLVEYQSVSFVK